MGVLALSSDGSGCRMVVLVFAWFIIACHCMFYILASKFLHR
jgi:hypothetical protein